MRWLCCWSGWACTLSSRISSRVPLAMARKRYSCRCGCEARTAWVAFSAANALPPHKPAHLLREKEAERLLCITRHVWCAITARIRLLNDSGSEFAGKGDWERWWSCTSSALSQDQCCHSPDTPPPGFSDPHRKAEALSYQQTGSDVQSWLVPGSDCAGPDEAGRLRHREQQIKRISASWTRFGIRAAWSRWMGASSPRATPSISRSAAPPPAPRYVSLLRRSW